MSPYTNDLPDPEQPAKRHTYKVQIVGNYTFDFTIIEPDTIEAELERLNDDSGYEAYELLCASLEGTKDSTMLARIFYSPYTPSIASLVSNALSSPDPQSEAYLSIIESFNELRVRMGLPALLTLIYKHGQQNPTA